MLHQSNSEYFAKHQTKFLNCYILHLFIQPFFIVCLFLFVTIFFALRMTNYEFQCYVSTFECLVNDLFRLFEILFDRMCSFQVI